MGQFIPDRFFWARGTDDEANPPEPKADGE